MPDDPASQLCAIATRGYRPGLIGRELHVGQGEGVLGTAAMRARPVWIGNLQRLLMYGSTVRRMHLEDGARAAEELAMPGLTDAQSHVAVPVMFGGQVTGVRVRHYLEDGSTFLDDEYLVRGVPGRLLWKLLTEATAEGRRDFTNREVRLDPALELPAHRDNFESRLILLTRRLQERDAAVQIEKTGRGRFRLVLAAPMALEAV